VFKKNAGLKKGNNIIWIDDEPIGILPAGAYVVETGTENFVKRIKVMKQ
jgi:hypothetical protein